MAYGRSRLARVRGGRESLLAQGALPRGQGKELTLRVERGYVRTPTLAVGQRSHHWRMITSLVVASRKP